jgi:hypothetical protein
VTHVWRCWRPLRSLPACGRTFVFKPKQGGHASFSSTPNPLRSNCVERGRQVTFYSSIPTVFELIIRNHLDRFEELAVYADEFHTHKTISGILKSLS